MIAPLVIFADDVDDLFSTPDETVEGLETVGETGEGIEQASIDQEDTDQVEQPEEKLDIASLTQSLLPRVGGNVSLSSGFVAGFQKWDFSDQEENVSAYYTLGANISFDIRPTSDFRFYSALGVSLNRDTLKINAPSVKEIFVDYTLLDAVFFRIGKQKITWGQKILLGFNPGNINVDQNGNTDIIALKAFFPLGNNGLTVAVYPGSSTTSPLEFAYSALFEAVLGPLSLGLSLKFQKPLSQALVTGIYLKTAILGIDIALEARADFDPYPKRDGYLTPRVQLISNFFWESSVGIRLLGEYYFNYGPEVRVSTAIDETAWAERGEHVLGLGVLFTKLFPNDWKPGLRWFHHFIDNSGQVIMGISGTILPNLRADIAIPLIYGPDYGYYARTNEDPRKRVVSLVVQFTLSASF